MSFDFPASPADGTIYAPPGGPQYQYSGGAWRVASSSVPIATAEARNRVVNPAMQISQENGNTASVLNAYYPADQWYIGNAGVGQCGAQRLQVTTPRGSRDRLLLASQSVNASLGASAIVYFLQTIEGTRIADFLWGTAQAKPAVLRFGFRAGVAGTYAVSLRTVSGSHSFVAPIVVTAGQVGIDVEYTVLIPAPTVGTWSNDNTGSLLLAVSLAVGATFVTPTANVWQAGNFVGLTGMTNGVAANGTAFNLFDVGLYLDPLNTGIAPPWTMPDEAQELLACMRYWQILSPMIVSGYSIGAGVNIYASYPALPMRVTPSVAYASVAYTNAASLRNNSVDSRGLMVVVSASAAGSALATFSANLNARM
jgi:hypothetical protein